MNEPRKMALVFLVVMAIGLIALAIEWLREKVSGWLWLLLIAVSILLLLLALALHPARAHDLSRPDLEPWYQSLMQPDNPAASCCGEADAYWCDDYYARDGRAFCRITDDRPDEPSRRAHVEVGTEFEIPGHKLKWDSSNPTGHAIVFLSRGGYVYCFVQSSGI